MSVFSTIKNWLKKTFGGSSSSSSSARRARTVSNYGGGGSRSYSSTSRYLPKEPIESKQQRMEREAKERKAKQDATTKALASTIDRKAKDVESKLNTTSAKATSGVDRVIKKMGERAKSAPPDPKQAAAHKSQERAKKRLESIKAERAEFHERTGHKYDPEVIGKKKAAQLAKGGFDVADPVAEQMAVEYHPIAYSAARGGLSGVTLGASELAIKAQAKRDEERAKNEQYYQKNKNKYAEFGGEMLGSLATFGITGGLSKAVAGNALNKVGGKEAAERLFENQVAKLAGSEVVKKAARREAMMAARQGAIKAVDEEVVKKFALDRARRILNGVAEDMAINATTGLVYDLTSSATDSNSLGEFGKNMLINAGMNAVVGGLQPVGGALLRTNRGALEAAGRIFADEAGDAVARNADEVIERAAVNAVEDNADNVARTAEPPRMAEEVAPPPMQEEVPPPPMREEVAPPKEEPKPNTTERKQAQKNTTESKSKALRKELDELRAERDRIIKGIEDKYGTRNPDFKSLSEEERSAVAAQKKRLQEIKKREDVASKEFNEAIRTESASEPAPTSTRAEKEAERDAVNKEYLALKKKISDAEKSGDLYEGIDADRIRLDELQSRRDTLSNSLGTQAKERKTRSDKGKKKPKPEPKAKAEPEVKAKPEPKVEAPERTYKDVDTKRYVKKADRPLLESRINELRAEKQTLEATGKASDAKRIEEITAEMSELQRALNLKKNQKIKYADVDEANAKKAAQEAKASAEAKTNAKPMGEAKVTDKEANRQRLKTVKGKKLKPDAAEKYRREIRTEYDHYNAEIQKATDGKYGMRKGVKSVSEMASTEETKRIHDEIGKALENARSENINTNEFDNSEVIYKRWDKARRDKLIDEGYARAADDPAGVVADLKAKAEKIINGDDEEHITLKNIAEMLGVKQVYKDSNVKLPEEYEQIFTRMTLAQKTEHAQGLSVTHLLLKENDESFRKKLIRRDLDKFRSLVCGTDDWAEIKKSLDENKGIADWLDKEVERLGKLKTTDEEFRKAYTDLQKDIFRNAKPTVWDTINLYRHAFMLSSLKTGFNNIIGNISMRAMYDISDKLTLIGESLAHASSKNKGEVRRTTALLKTADQKKLANMLTEGKVTGKLNTIKNFDDPEFARRINEAAHADVHTMMGNEKWGFKFEKGADYKGGSAAKRLIDKVGRGANKGVAFMLNEPDNWFVERNYRSALLKYLQANGIDSGEKLVKNTALFEDARKHAMNIARENTYKQTNRIVNLLERQRAKGYKSGSTLLQKGVSIALDAEAPYLKVPANLIVNNFKYSPMNVVKGSWDVHRALKSGNVNDLNKAVAELSKGLTGTGLFALGFLMNCDEQEADDSWGFIAKAKDELKEYNYRDNSFKLGDKNFNLANMGIGSVQLLMGARYADELNKNGGAPATLLDDVEAIASAFATTFDAVADMSLLDNATQTLDSLSNKGDYDMSYSERIGNLGLKVGSDYMGQFVASPLKGLAKGFTEADLDTNVKKGDTGKVERTIERNANNLVSGVPVLNEKVLAHKVDSHGNLINERKTTGDKVKQALINYADPFSTRTTKVPDADKVELKVKNDNGEGYKPKEFDANRTFKAKFGKGSEAEEVDLSRKQREMAARSVKSSGKEMANSLVYAKRAWFGDSHGERAQQVLREVPEDEEKAREYLYNTPEFKALKTDDERKDFMDALYVGSGSRKNYEGRERASNRYVAMNVAGKTEGEFRFANDLTKTQQEHYKEYDLESLGIDKGKYADVIDELESASHKYKDGENKDQITSKKVIIPALLADPNLTTEQRIAIYEAQRGNRNWKDWDGVSGAGGSYRRGYRRWRRYGHGGGSSKKAKVPTPKTIKASQLVKGEALVSKKSSSSAKATAPTLKRVEAKIDLPKVKR